jgi:hypothetical protein
MQRRDLMALSCFFGVAWLSLHTATEPAEITAIVLDAKQISRTEEVRLVRVGTTTKEPLTVGAKMNLGDSLESASGKILVELRCANGTMYTFRDIFRIAIVPPSKTGCAINVLSGGLDVLTDRPTEVNAGGIHLGTEGTAYSVTVNLEGTAMRSRLAVFEGRASVSDAEPVGQGEVLEISKGARQRGTVNPQRDVLPTASTFAQLDVAHAQGVEVGSEALKSLTALHAQVLTTPNDREQRIELARAQKFYRVQDYNFSYQLRRLGITERELLDNPERELPDSPARELPDNPELPSCVPSLQSERWEMFDASNKIALGSVRRWYGGEKLWRTDVGDALPEGVLLDALSSSVPGHNGSFVLRIFFGGLIAFVPSPDGKELIVLLLNAGHDYALSDGTRLEHHRPLLLARAAQCEGSCGATDAEIARYLFPDISAERAGDSLQQALLGGGAWQLDGSELSIRPGGAGAKASPPDLELRQTVRLSKSGKPPVIPNTPQEREDFRWVPDLGKIDPSVGGLNPAVLSDHPPADLIAARLKLTHGRVFTYRLARVRNNVEPIQFRPLQGGGKEAPCQQALATWVEADVEVQGDAVEIVGGPFGGNEKRVMKLSPQMGGKAGIEMAILNLPPLDHSLNAAERTTQGIPYPGKHFEVYYELMKMPPPKPMRLVPQAARTITQIPAASWGDLHPSKQLRSDLLEKIQMGIGRGPYDTVIFPLIQISWRLKASGRLSRPSPQGPAEGCASPPRRSGPKSTAGPPSSASARPSAWRTCHWAGSGAPSNG